jgi:hypothetical protein
MQKIPKENIHSSLLTKELAWQHISENLTKTFSKSNFKRHFVENPREKYILNNNKIRI